MRHHLEQTSLQAHLFPPTPSPQPQEARTGIRDLDHRDGGLTESRGYLWKLGKNKKRRKFWCVVSAGRLYAFKNWKVSLLARRGIF